MDSDKIPMDCKEVSGIENDAIEAVGDTEGSIREVQEATGLSDSSSKDAVLSIMNMSKKQRKRLLKHQRYVENKNLRKMKRKEKRRQQQEKKRQQAEETDPQTAPPVKRKRKMQSPSASSLRVAIDLSFDELMARQEINKLVKQMQRCYAVNRRAEHPLQLYLTSFGGQSQQKLEEVGGQYRSWDVHIKNDKLTELFPKEDIVYLTSESPNVLEKLDVTKVYVIGGLVDHNHHKGLCYRQAVEAGLAHGQLPIGDYVKLNCRKVLAVNHVFEILLRFTETQDWKDAFFEVLPARKVLGAVESEEKATAEKGEVCFEDDCHEKLYDRPDSPPKSK